MRNPGFRFRLREKPAGSARPKDPGGAGTVSIEIPRFKGRLGRGFCKVASISPEINVNLDAYGSIVWLLIDGTTSVRDIGVVVKEEFGEKVEPLYGRLANFLSLLERNNLINYTNLPLNLREKHG